ncbi:MAG: glycosyltransferase 87 family protein [Candidatus Ventricola sp.]
MEHNRRVRSLWLALGMTLALFAVQTALISSWLSHISGAGQALALSALFALVYGGTMAAFIVLQKPKTGTLVFAGVFAAIAMLARVSMLDFVSADYYSFLSLWVDVFREGGVELLAENVGDYNLIYQYFLMLVAKAPLHDLYLIKYLSVLFDCLLALAMMRAAERFAGEKAALPVFLTVMALPTVLFDGACWAQCDSVYVLFIIMSLYFLETDRPVRSAVFLSVAFAFKLQTIFFFPVVLLGLIHKKYRLRDALAFFAAYVVTMLPALMAGRSFLDALSVYANQSMGQYYDRLSYNAPNLYLFFPMMDATATQEYIWMRYIEGIDNKGTNAFLHPDLLPDLQHAALYACVILVLIAVIYWLIHWKEITPDMTLEFALFWAIFLPFVMPKMHERYFYLADMLSILYAAKYPRRRFLPLLVIGSSLMCYVPYLMRQRPIDERVLALMMLAALVIVGRDLLTRMRVHRVSLGKGGEAA